MLKEGQIIQKVSEVSELLKSNQEKRGKKSDVIYHSTYMEEVSHSQELSVHADGNFPANLINEAHPNETDEEFQYRKDNYQAVTMPSWSKALKAVNRIWNPNNYTIKWGKTESKYEDFPAQDYFEKEYPVYQSILKYFQSVVTDYTFKDPNALIVVKPKKLPEAVDENGDLKVDQSKMIEPVALIYESKDIISYEEDVYAIFKTSEKSKLDDDEEGLILEMYDTDNIYRVIQVGKKEDFNFSVYLYYSHCLNELPVSRLSGIYTQKGDTAYLKSYFNPALPNLNLAVITSSTLFMSEQAHAFPQRYEYVQKCHHEGCFGGKVEVQISDSDMKMKTIDCPSCGGTGNARPLKTKQIPMPDSMDDSSVFNALPSPPMGYVSPSDTILKFSQDRIDNQINHAFSFVGIDVSVSKPQGGEVALSKMIDREETFAFLLKIKNDIFPLYERTINLIGKMRYSICDANGLQDFWNKPEITYPVDFSIKTEAEIVAEIREASDAGVDKSAIRVLNEIYSTKRFNPSGESESVTKLIYNADSLTTLSNVEINSNLSVGRIEMWQAVLHDNINIYIQDLMDEDEEFLKKDLSVQKEKVIALAKADALLLTSQSSGSTQSIISVPQ